MITILSFPTIAISTILSNDKLHSPTSLFSGRPATKPSKEARCCFLLEFDDFKKISVTDISEKGPITLFS
ncbi:unnamed protein product [Rhizophagus irregularis]|nr:unnamed protein product [Rhizophagus irregularis]CAB5186484.1 unnamed protein product [Rhizophagus irregularis]